MQLQLYMCLGASEGGRLLTCQTCTSSDVGYFKLQAPAYVRDGHMSRPHATTIKRFVTPSQLR